MTKKEIAAIKIDKHPLIEVQYDLIFKSELPKYKAHKYFTISAGKWQNEWYWWFNKSCTMYHGKLKDIRRIVSSIRSRCLIYSDNFKIV